MKCPYCLNSRTKVVDKRNLEELDAIRRRRECMSCGRRFTSYERIELAGFAIIKKDGRRESYNRNKLTSGLIKACEKRPIRRDEIEKCVAGIEAELKSCEEKEFPSKAVGEIVMDKLRELDKVAYIRFASVYREFTDLRSFQKELTSLKKRADTEPKGRG